MDHNHSAPVNMALFIDIENLIGAASSLGLPVDLVPLLQRLKGQGRVLIRRSYGDIKKCLEMVGRPKLEDQVRRMLIRTLVQIEDIPYVTAHKNTADMRLVVDALSEAFTNPAISHFVILSSDRDYIPLCNKLHELNKTVIAIVVDRQNVNPMVIEAADRVEYYETLFAAPEAPPPPAPAPGVAAPAPGATPPAPDPARDDSMATTEVAALRREYFRVLQEAIQHVERESHRCVGARVAPKMQQLRSDFEPANIGLRAFKDFVREAEREGIVRVDWGDGKSDYHLQLGGVVLVAPPRPAPPPAKQVEGDIKKAARAYRRFLEDKLKTPLPDFATRREILLLADKSRLELGRNGPFMLAEWKDDISNHSLRKFDDRLVYKMLLSMHYARCFYCEVGGAPTNPVIVGLKIDPDRWDHAIVTNFCKQLLLEPNMGRLIPEALADTFYQGVPDARARIDAVLEELAR